MVASMRFVCYTKEKWLNINYTDWDEYLCAHPKKLSIISKMEMHFNINVIFFFYRSELITTRLVHCAASAATLDHTVV